MKETFAHIDYSELPDYMRRGMKLYLEYGEMPGGFLTAVLANDLHFAAKRADMQNRFRFQQYIDFFLGSIPSKAWGSYENVYFWMIHRKAYHDQKITAAEIDDMVDKKAEDLR